jgi:hypothetical protein
MECWNSGVVESAIGGGMELIGSHYSITPTLQHSSSLLSPW